MDINNIALIIVTAFINLAVSIFVFYRYQKKIDDTYAKSMLAYQTKYVRNQEKTVETLQILYQKVVLYSIEFNDIIDRTFFYIIGDSDKGVSITEYQEVFEKFKDSQTFFIENRLFLSEEIAYKIQSILGWIRHLHNLASDNLSSEKKSEYIHSRWAILSSLKNYDEFHSKKYSNEEWEELHFGQAASELGQFMSQSVKELEDLYKSVAEISD